jgi:hypothetical protein
MARAKKYHHVEAAKQRWASCERACADYDVKVKQHCDYGMDTGKSYMSVKKKCDYYVNKSVLCMRSCLRRRGGSGRKYRA